VLLFSATAILFVFGSPARRHFLRPSAPTREKSMIYECGEKPIARLVQLQSALLLIALVFVIFEVEIAFMFPVASVYKSFIEKGQGLLAFAEIFVFVGESSPWASPTSGRWATWSGEGPEAGRAAVAAGQAAEAHRHFAKKAA